MSEMLRSGAAKADGKSWDTSGWRSPDKDIRRLGPDDLEKSMEVMLGNAQAPPKFTQVESLIPIGVEEKTSFKFGVNEFHVKANPDRSSKVGMGALMVSRHATALELGSTKDPVIEMFLTRNGELGVVMDVSKEMFNPGEGYRPEDNIPIDKVVAVYGGAEAEPESSLFDPEDMRFNRPATVSQSDVIGAGGKAFVIQGSQNLLPGDLSHRPEDVVEITKHPVRSPEGFLIPGQHKLIGNYRGREFPVEGIVTPDEAAELYRSEALRRAHGSVSEIGGLGQYY